jgi:hypothetical protein
MNHNQCNRNKRVLWLAVAAVVVTSLACGGPTSLATSAPPTATFWPTITEGPAPRPTVAPTSAPQEVPTSAPASASDGAPTYGLGQEIFFADTRMIFLGWSEPEPDEYSSPEPGNKYVDVDVLWVNTGSTAADSTSLAMTLMDDSGRVYEEDLDAPIGGMASLNGTLVPGERIRAMVGFQVPQNVSGLTLVYDDTEFGGVKFFVDLGNAPTSIDPPTGLLAGERRPETFAIGDEVEVGDFYALTVNSVNDHPADLLFPPDPGYKFVLVDVTIRNVATTSDTINSVLQMGLKDATGHLFNENFVAEGAAGVSFPNGSIAPDQELNGQVGFQVPQDASGLVFVFSADMFGAYRVFVSLE